MKKLFALMLCLCLLIPAALAETDEIALETRLLDLSDFSMLTFTIDAVDVQQKADGAIWCTVYPLYNETVAFHDTIRVVWYATDLTDSIKLVGAERYASEILEETLRSYNSAGVSATNAQLLSARYENDQLTFAYRMELDYLPMGIDLQVTMWQMQVFILRGEAGSYSFTLTADTLEDLNLQTYYLGTVLFPENESAT